MISSLELARICGVSQGTVDRALHNRKGISEATKQRILRAAAKHGYRSHPVVRELLGGERIHVGALIPVANSIFFMDLIHAIRASLVAAGFRFFTVAADDADTFLEALGDMAARRCCAAVVVPPQDEVRIPKPLTRAMPVFSLINPSRGHNVSFVAPDEQATGRTAVEYLYGLGHRRILHLTYARRSDAIRKRALGFRTAVRQHGLSGAVLASVDEPALLQAIGKHHATALFCHNDWLALTALRFLERNGLRVPQDLSVLGVDDSPSFTAICPDISTLAYPAKAIGDAIAAALSEGGRLRPIPPPALVERRTTAQPACT